MGSGIAVEDLEDLRRACVFLLHAGLGCSSLEEEKCISAWVRLLAVLEVTE